jgi:aryl-phospho-beta-D-glucosidase BglC (GH1 family)
MGFLKKFKTEMKSAFNDDKPSYPAQQQQQSQMPISDQPASLQEPSSSDVYRYRYQHGTNFGSIFVLEKWLTGSMYPENADSAELAAVTGNIKAMGLDAARQKFENHWETYISDSDLDWLANQAHCKFVAYVICIHELIE